MDAILILYVVVGFFIVQNLLNRVIKLERW